jgi:tetratricopeptide (TPR) repeat protein
MFRSLSAGYGLGLCLLTGLVFAASSGLWAREAIAGDAEDKAAARAHYETGTRLYDVRDYAEALKEFKAAYLAKPDPAFLFNMGQCNLKMGKNQEALDFFQQFLKKAPPDHPNRGLVETRIRNIQAGISSESEPADGARTGKPVVPPPEPPAPSPPVPPVAAPVFSAPATSPQPSVLPPPAAPMEPSPAVDLSTNAQNRQPVPAPTPFYSTWWFWTGVGAVVAGGAVATYLLLPRGGGTSVPEVTLGTRTLP